MELAQLKSMLLPIMYLFNVYYWIMSLIDTNANCVQEADLAPNSIFSSHWKYKISDLTVAIRIQPLDIIVPWPEEEAQHFTAMIRPFQPTV